MIDMPKALRLIRASLGLNQTDIAQAAGIHPTAFSRMERGDRFPSIDSTDRIAKAVEIPFELLASFAANIDDPVVREDRDQRFFKWLQKDHPMREAAS